MDTILHLMRAALALLLSMFLYSSAMAQKEHNVWHFGLHAAIDFNTDPPTAFSGPLNTIEGSATICDGKSGELLFSSDGIRIFNRNGAMIKGFSPLDPNDIGTSTQAAIIIPFPNDIFRYYVIFADQSGYAGPNEGVKLFVVDMRGDAGLGEVINMPVVLFQTDMTEKLTAIPHANGCDVWILTHRQHSNEYMATLLHESDVSMTPVITSIGQVPEADGRGTEAGIGWLVASQQGDRIAYASYSGLIELLKFDRSTGQLSDLFSMPVDYGTYGMCFSPDGTKLYAGNAAGSQFAQYDLSLAPNAIRASEVRFGSLNGGAIRPMPDGKLYCSSGSSTWLHIIERPNEKGLACRYVENGVEYVTNTNSSWGLPNIPDAMLGRSMRPCLSPQPNPPVSILADRTTVCAGDCIQLNALDAGGRWVYWRTGDGNRVSGQTSTSLCFDQPGSYDVELFAINGSGDTASARITITVQPIVELSLRSFTLSTDTIGATIKVPIILSDVIDADFQARFRFPQDLLDFLGAYDTAGKRIDVTPVGGMIDINTHVNKDSVVGYMYFDLYWENQPCRAIELLSSSIMSGGSQCLTTRATALEVCLQGYCGERTISDAMRRPENKLSIAYTPDRDVVTMLSSEKLEHASVVIVDVNGRIVIDQTRDLAPAVIETFDVSALPQGVYFARVSDRLTTFRKSFVIVR